MSGRITLFMSICMLNSMLPLTTPCPTRGRTSMYTLWIFHQWDCPWTGRGRGEGGGRGRWCHCNVGTLFTILPTAIVTTCTHQTGFKQDSNSNECTNVLAVSSILSAMYSLPWQHLTKSCVQNCLHNTSALLTDCLFGNLQAHMG